VNRKHAPYKDAYNIQISSLALLEMIEISGDGGTSWCKHRVRRPGKGVNGPTLRHAWGLGLGASLFELRPHTSLFKLRPQKSLMRSYAGQTGKPA